MRRSSIRQPPRRPGRAASWFWRGEVRTFRWAGAAITDPDFTGTCYGFFLELAKYVNHAEFQRLDDTDPDLVALGRRITRIAFEHNLIFIHRGDNSQPSNYVRNQA